VAVLEDDLGALDVGDQRAHGLLDDQAHAHGRRQVDDDVALVHELVHDRGREDGIDHEVEVPPFAELGDVGRVGGREVVEAEDLVAAREQGLAQVAADEAGPAGDQGLGPARMAVRAAHWCFPLVSSVSPSRIQDGAPPPRQGLRRMV
jgi:hypothetical protein